MGSRCRGVVGLVGPSSFMSSSDHSVLVPDTELLFTAQFHRAGPDLVLTGRDGAASFSSRLLLKRASPGLGGAERRASFARYGRSARRIADAGTLCAGAAHRAGRRHRQNRKSRRRRHRGAQRRNRRAPCRRRRVQERRGPDRRQLVVRHFVSRRHRAQSGRQYAHGAQRLCVRRQQQCERRAVHLGRRHLRLRRRQGGAFRRHEDRDAGRDHGHSRHHRRGAGAARHARHDHGERRRPHLHASRSCPISAPASPACGTCS